MQEGAYSGISVLQGYHLADTQPPTASRLRRNKNQSNSLTFCASISQHPTLHPSKKQKKRKNPSTKSKPQNEFRSKNKKI
jgi:hypothetical protein